MNDLNYEQHLYEKRKLLLLALEGNQDLIDLLDIELQINSIRRRKDSSRGLIPTGNEEVFTLKVALDEAKYHRGGKK